MDLIISNLLLILSGLDNEKWPCVCQKVQLTTSAGTGRQPWPVADKCITNTPAQVGHIRKNEISKMGPVPCFFKIWKETKVRLMGGWGRAGSVKSNAAGVLITCHSSHNLSFD